jgi:hypothetical protein
MHGYWEGLTGNMSSTSIVVPRPTTLYKIIDTPVIKSEKVLTSVGRLALVFGLCGTVPLALGMVFSAYQMLPSNLCFAACYFQVISAPLATVLGLLSTRRLTGQAGLFLGIIGILFLLFVRIFIVHMDL